MFYAMEAKDLQDMHMALPVVNVLSARACSVYSSQTLLLKIIATH